MSRHLKTTMTKFASTHNKLLVPVVSTNRSAPPTTGYCTTLSPCSSVNGAQIVVCHPLFHGRAAAPWCQPRLIAPHGDVVIREKSCKLTKPRVRGDGYGKTKMAISRSSRAGRDDHFGGANHPISITHNNTFFKPSSE